MIILYRKSYLICIAYFSHTFIISSCDVFFTNNLKLRKTLLIIYSYISTTFVSLSLSFKCRHTRHRDRNIATIVTVTHKKKSRIKVNLPSLSHSLSLSLPRKDTHKKYSLITLSIYGTIYYKHKHTRAQISLNRISGSLRSVCVAPISRLSCHRIHHRLLMILNHHHHRHLD